MQTIAIFSRKFSPEHRQYLQKIISHIDQEGGKVLLYKELHKNIEKVFRIPNLAGTFSSTEDLKKCTDMIISLGGDGTLLECVTYVKDSEIPVLGINIGRLGFLSSVGVSDIQPAITAVFNNNFTISKRTLLKVTSISGHSIPEPSFAMNDITVSKRDSNSMIVVHAQINDIRLNSYWADGLIVTTPTGSTAYSLSCSGPILTPDSQNFIINPIAPHNLSVRPIVFPDHSIIKLEIDGRSSYFHLTLDSRTMSIKTGSIIEIEKESFQVHLVTLPGDSFFHIIRDKLQWGSDKRN